MSEKEYKVQLEIVDNESSNDKGVTVLLVEQNANMALKTAHTGYVLETGNIVLKGTGESLLADESVREAYLGKKK